MMLKRMTVVGVMAVWTVSVWGLTPAEFETLYDHELRLVVSGCTTAPQEDFSLLVRLSEAIPGFRYSQLRSNGADIRFALEDGTVLPHECDTWNPSGESTFWVKVPQLKQGLALRMHYGRDNDTAPDGSAVWGSDYVGVWHMNIRDAAVAESVNGFHGLVSGQVQAGVGIVGGSYLNPSKNTDVMPCVYVGDTNGSYAAFAAFSGQVSFSAWIRYDGTAGAGKYGRWWHTCGNSDLYAGMFGLDYALENSATSMSLSDGGTRAAGIACPNMGGDWHHVVVSYAEGHRSVYIDGVAYPDFDNCETAVYKPLSAEEWVFGARKRTAAGNDEQWIGGLDEFRAQRFAVTAERVVAEYEMVKGGPGYLSYERILSSEERASYARCYTLRVNGFDGPQLADYRLLVRLSAESVPGFDPADSLSAGGDFAFTTEGGVVLPYECDTWSPSGESTFWVRVPQMVRGLVLKMYYGKANENASDPRSVWNGYTGVWHMNVANGAVAESANGFDGAVSNASQVVAADGRIGGCYLNPSQTAGSMPCISVGDTNGSYAAFNALTESASFSAWIKYTGGGTSGKYGRWWNTANGSAEANMLGLDCSLEGGATSMTLSDFGARTTKTIKNVANDWHCVVVQYDGSLRKIYLDGVECESFRSEANSYRPRTDSSWVFGAKTSKGTGTAEQWVGGLDEFRVYPSALEPTRLLAEYKMLSSDSSYIHFVDETQTAAFLKHVDVTVSGYSGTDVLTNFPVCVRVSPQTIRGFRSSDLRADGRDLMFATTNGVPLDFEVDTWDPQGESVYWVRVPELVNGTVIRMNYGRLSPYHNGAVVGAVWSEYAGIWHLSESEDGAISVADSAPNAVMTTGGSNSISTNGVYGLARGSRLSGNNGPSAISTASAGKIDVGTTFTVSFYIRRGVYASSYAYLVTRKAGSDLDNAWGVQSRSSQALAPGFWSGNDSPAPSAAYTFDLMDINRWCKIDIVYDGYERLLYVDGTKVALETKTSLPSWGNLGLAFGGPTNFSGTFAGDMDEIRYQAGRRSDAWIKAEYDMSGLGGGTPFLTYGKATRYEPVGLMLIFR